jgi:Pyruvate/2-oxoglutarate dehydrogenase complex, dehydrogenase (E1) component, eukaryotic type, alpha subunit
MYLIRRAEEILMAEYHPADQMRCPMHFCVGQEAMPAALAPVIRRSDILMSHYRSHGYYLAKGAPLEAMVAEFYGKKTGANLGIAGSMELASHEHNFYSGAIVGGSLYMPLGGAFAQKYRGVDDISISIIGDGVFDEGITYEIFNLAALYQLPFLIICENNKYAAHTPIEKRQAVAKLAERAQAFGIPFEKHDGNDAVLLLQVLERIVPEIRAGKGPRCIEIATYRFCGHVGRAKTRAWAIAAQKRSSNGRCAIRSPRCAVRLWQASKTRSCSDSNRASTPRFMPPSPRQSEPNGLISPM